MLENIEDMSVTALVSHSPMSWLKASEKLNIWDMLVTALVSHSPMSSLKALEKSALNVILVKSDGTPTMDFRQPQAIGDISADYKKIYKN